MNNGQAVFRGFAGAYVFYTGFNLLVGLKNGNPAFSVPVTIIMAVVLLGFGGYFLYSALVGIKKEVRQSPEEESQDISEEVSADELSIGEIAEEIIEEAIEDTAEE